MTLRDRIPVEPLSDERMTNIERRVVIAASETTQPAPRRMRWMPIVAAAAVIAVGFGAWRLGASSVTAPVVAGVEPLRVDTMEGTKLDIGDARIASDPGTKFVVTRPAGGVLVEMARGKVELEVGKRGDRAPLVVRAGDTDVTVVGTRFSVDYGDGTGEVEVVVTEGVVQVTKRNVEPIRVAIGQAWTTARGAIAIADLPATKVAAAGSTVKVATTTDTLSTVHEPTEIEMVDPKPGTGSGSAGPRKKKTVVYEVDAHKALLKAPIQPALDIGVTDPREAIQKHFEAASNGRNDDASRAFYSAAFIQKFQLKDNAAALRTLDLYMSRFVEKNKAEHADALWLRVRILCERTFDDACRNAARIYSEAAPSTQKSGIADEILKTPR